VITDSIGTHAAVARFEAYPPPDDRAAAGRGDPRIADESSVSSLFD
jgi:hypothetical protein